ncbi:endolytic transglycosylase MltG [Rhodococcus sp. X156]|uniref:endolytic transglycosylase MltG n=1 Tax=Rhodococcus sp. X156 TaxID=2499145 RepID=UPI001F49B9C4|nr:endolytic transglycosylase MltG [Rhodococcus sp. X156]
MSDSFDGGRTRPGAPRTPGHDDGGEEWGRRSVGPRFVAPPPGAATGDSVLEPDSLLDDPLLDPDGYYDSDHAGEPDWADEHDYDAGPARSRRTGPSRVHATRRRVGVAVALVVLLVLGGVVYLGGKALFGQFSSSETEDYAGGGESDVVFRVMEGDTAGAIGAALVRDDVVSSASLFTKAAANDTRMASVQPGFYKLRTKIPAATAVSRLVDPKSRVGGLVIPEGRQLDDVRGKDGSVTPGILSTLAKASCVELDGERRCTSEADLRTAAATADLDDLGVPDWAKTEVQAASSEKEKRIEGLIRPGSYDVEPGAPATTLLQRMISSSATALQLAGLPEANVDGLTPYQVLVVASLNEREVKPGEYDKVTRVILNRLKISQKLEFDSTVNYPLDLQYIATTPKDRATVTPWNTYASPGLPLTPIASPGEEAITGAMNPAEGTWHYFVTCGTQGATCFSDTYDQHLAIIAGGGGPP